MTSVCALHDMLPDSIDSSAAHVPIVITGAGLSCALGLTKDEAWRAVVAGTCGIGALTAIEQFERCSKGGGQAPDLPKKLHKGLPREVRYLRHVIAEALAQSKFFINSPAPDRCGAVFGTTLAGMRSAGAYFRSGDLTRFNRFTAASIAQLALEGLPISGAVTTTCSACASGLSSVAIALTMLRTGQLDLVIAGGYDTLSEYAYAGFNSLRLVTSDAIMPFSKDRAGMKLGEGYGIVVLERMEDARRRGAVPLAQVLGLGESSDAHHLTQPHPEGDGARRAMEAALVDAGVDAQEVDMIAAHATSTPNNDAAEFKAYQQIFRDRLPQVPVVAFKSHLGHTLGGAGAVELILSILAIQHQCVPPTANVDLSAIEFPGLRLLDRSLPIPIARTMNLSMGFGGANACIVLGKAEQTRKPIRARPSSASERDVMITGVGIVMPKAIGNERFEDVVKRRAIGFAGEGGGIADAEIEHLISARRVRRMSEFAKTMLAAATVAIKDACIDDFATFAESCHAILGSAHGAVDFSEKYYRQIVEEGVDAANPMLFAEGVPNVASAQLSLMLNIQGSTQTIVGSRSAAMEALCVAMWRIRSGAWERAIVGAADEHHPLVDQAYAECGGRNGRTGSLVSSSGAVALILESRSEVERRGAGARGVVRNGRIGRLVSRCPREQVNALARFDHSLGPADPIMNSILPIHESFSVVPLARLATTLFAGSRGGRHNIVAHDQNGIVAGASVEVI